MSLLKVEYARLLIQDIQIFEGYTVFGDLLTKN